MRIGWIVIAVVAVACGDKKTENKPAPKTEAPKEKDKPKEPEKKANTGGKSLGDLTAGSGSGSGSATTTDAAPRPAIKPVAGDCAWKIEDVALAAVCEYRCTLDEREPCALAAKKIAAGEGIKADSKRANELALRACELQSAIGCTLAANADASKADEYTTKSKTFAERDCADGIGQACWQVAMGQDVKAATATFKKGTELLKAGCDGGDGAQCAILAVAYGTGGKAVEKDVMQGAELRKKACEHNHASTCFELAKESSKEDKRSALVDKACTLGLRAACGKLALELAGQNTMRSAQINQRACQLGELDACIRQGEDHAKRSEKEKAVEMFTRACQLGNDRGCAQARALGK